jgi:cytochrome c biogenesis protein CcdA
MAAVFALGLLLIFMALPAMPMSPDRPVQVVFIYSHGCTLCERAGPIVQKAAADGHADLVKYEFNSQEGIHYVRASGIDTVPAFVINGGIIRFEDYNGDTGRLDTLLRQKIDMAKNCPLRITRNVSRSKDGVVVTTCVSNHGPETIKAHLNGGVCEGAKLVSGEQSWSGDVLPGMEKHISYRMKVYGNVSMLPPQRLVYEDKGGTHDMLGPETPLAAYRGLSVMTAFLAGIVAGINPCLIAVMVFISTMTLSSEHKGRKLAIDVCSFCVGLLSMYFLIGIGFLRLMQGTPSFGSAIRLAIILLLSGFAIWSFYDAYSVNKKPDKRSIFKSLVGRIRPLYVRYGIAASFLLGGAFGLVKMPCVGGMYIAILGAIFDSGDLSSGIACLASYNVGIVLPVLALGLLLTMGLSPEKVNAFRYRHRAAMKAVTGLLLVAMAAGLAFNII